MATVPSGRVHVPSTAVTIHAVAGVGTIRLAWRDVPGVEGYAVHGVPCEADVRWHPALTNLLGAVQHPRFRHDRLGPAAVRWSYLVQPLPAERFERLVLQAQSRTSVTRTGSQVVAVGDFAGGAGLSPAPVDFALYRSRFPRDVDFRIGYDRAETTWSCLHPGPEDAWAGRRAHRFRLRFDLDRLPEADLDLAIWLTDRHATHAGSATISVNGTPTEAVFFDDPGEVAGEAERVAGVPTRGAGPAYIERTVARERLRVGENTLDLTKDHGCWIAYAAVGLFARGR